MVGFSHVCNQFKDFVHEIERASLIFVDCNNRNLIKSIPSSSKREFEIFRNEISNSRSPLQLNKLSSGLRCEVSGRAIAYSGQLQSGLQDGRPLTFDAVPLIV